MGLDLLYLVDYRFLAPHGANGREPFSRDSPIMLSMSRAFRMIAISLDFSKTLRCARRISFQRALTVRTLDFGATPRDRIPVYGYAIGKGVFSRPSWLSADTGPPCQLGGQGGEGSGQLAGVGAGDAIAKAIQAALQQRGCCRSFLMANFRSPKLATS